MTGSHRIGGSKTVYLLAGFNVFSSLSELFPFEAHSRSFTSFDLGLDRGKNFLG